MRVGVGGGEVTSLPPTPTLIFTEVVEIMQKLDCYYYYYFYYYY